jgi:TRAP-type C4-dicarboxylate transport system permease large subunit
VIIGASPFVVTLVIMIAIICVFPDLVLWLPRLAK